MPKPYIIKKNRRVRILRKRVVLRLKRHTKKLKKGIQKNLRRVAAPLKKTYKRLIVNLMFTKTYSNMFLTAVNNRGGVLAVRSTGLCGLHSKKKKRSWDTLKLLAKGLANKLRLKNIRFIRTFYMRYRYFKNYKIILTQLKKSGILVNKLIYFNSTPHSLTLKRKKIRRI
jgi:hypothetical protein